MTIRKVRIHRFGGPEVLQVDQVEPSQPDAAQVLITVKAASINPVDYKIRSGKYPAVKEDRLPYTLGRDVSGTIEKLGAQATQFKVGDKGGPRVAQDLHQLEVQGDDESSPCKRTRMGRAIFAARRAAGHRRTGRLMRKFAAAE
jgi:D-arabinose 1-dehydrogenase-like Zn-dependent alcohol dehydrogenase